jgi:hypothetical protein
MVHSIKLTEFNRGSEPEGWISAKRHLATVHAYVNPTQTLELRAEEMKEGTDAITLIGRPVSATAVEDRVKHKMNHELPIEDIQYFRSQLQTRNC